MVRNSTELTLSDKRIINFPASGSTWFEIKQHEFLELYDQIKDSIKQIRDITNSKNNLSIRTFMRIVLASEKKITISNRAKAKPTTSSKKMRIIEILATNQAYKKKITEFILMDYSELVNQMNQLNHNSTIFKQIKDLLN